MVVRASSAGAGGLNVFLFSPGQVVDKDGYSPFVFISSSSIFLSFFEVGNNIRSKAWE